MPKMTISRSKKINASAEKIFSLLNDFNHWPAWSPWLIMEPETKLNIREDAKYYEWKGKRIGEGNMTITNEEENKSIDYDLEFLKPWKSKSKVRFEIESEGDQSKVTWFMYSSLPFFMFWMKKQMEAFVGMDYERGLNMLKEYAEGGEVNSKLEFKGESEFAGTKYVGIKNTTSMEKMETQMQEDFGKLETFMDQNKDLANDAFFTIYHKWDMVNGRVSYTGCHGVKSIPSDLPDGMISGEIPATKIYTMRHVGGYQHLGNAWSTLYAMHRGKEFKPVKGIHPFEEYVTDPKEVPEKESITDIHFAIKG